MKRLLRALSILIFLFFLCPKAGAQGNQIVSNGSSTTAVNFTGAGCTYNWVNDTPGIGLAASGTGDIASFTAVNNGSSPVKATITATPVGYAYITNFASNNVSVINTATNKVIATIAVGFSPFCVSVSPDGSRAYVSNGFSNTVSVINTSTNTIVSTIPVGSSPNEIIVSRDGKRVYLTNYSDENISVINTTSNTVIATIAAGTRPLGIAVSPDGSLLYVVNEFSNTVLVINAATKSVVSTISVGSNPSEISISPDGSRAYVSNENSNTISVINTLTNVVVSNIPVGSTPEGISISLDGGRLYVANTGSSTVSVINTATNGVIATISVGTLPTGISVSPDGSQVYVANRVSNTVSVINSSTNAVVSTIPVGSGPYSLGNFVTGGTGCTPVTFTITVNPIVPAVITASTAAGAISACAGSASASPDIQQFTVSGNNLTDDIIATAPTGFEVSLSKGSAYGNSVTLTPSGGGVSSTIVYVRSAAAASPGNKSGNVALTSSGATARTVTVKGTVHALPALNTVSNQTVLNGASTAAISFTGTGNTFSWVNDTPGIGLAASGIGDIASFAAINTSGSPVTATITATPVNAGFAYVANQGNGSSINGWVSVINTLTHAVVAQVPAGANPFAVSVSPDGQRVYVTNTRSNTVTVINALTNQVITNINVGSTPQGVAVSPDGSRIYVSNGSSSTVSVINAITNTVITNIPVGSNPWGMAVSPDGSKVYVTNNGSNTVSAISTATNAVIATFATGLNPAGIVVSPDGSTLYVANYVSRNISVINTSTGLTTALLDANGAVDGIALSPDGSRLYAANNSYAGLDIFDTPSNLMLGMVHGVGTGPQGVSVTPDGQQVYVTNDADGDIWIVNTKDNSTGIINTTNSQFSFGNFIAGGVNCPGTPVKFTITVSPSVPAAITTSTATGSISACAGSASTSPQIQQFTVSGSNLTGDITATAPPGFEVSLTAGSGYSNSVTITQTGGTINGTLVYVRSAASASTGNISGNVAITSPGATSQNVAVMGIVKVLPTVNPVSNQTVVNGNPTTAITFTGTGSAFTWVNDTPAIGLAASGTGNIASFTGVNAGASPVTANITVSPVGGSFAYIANETDNTISVVNTATNAVVSTIPVGTTPYGVTVSPDGTKVYVSNFSANTVSVISIATNAVTATITGVGPNPEGMAASPDGSLLYVANANVGTNTSFGTVSVINTATNTVTASITVGIRPTDVWISADGTRLYVANFLSNTVSVINTATNGIVASIAVGTSPNLVAETPDGSRLYVTNENSRNVSVINTANNTVTATINVGRGPDGLTISPDGTRVYVANGVSNTISVINTATNAVILTYTAVNTDPVGISLSNDGGRLYVENLFSNNVTVIDVTNTADKAFATIPVGLHPGSIGGNFITGSTGVCSGIPVKFTITVNSNLPTITASPATGNISACAGTASASPDIQQFTVSGTNLTGNITAKAPVGFEVSLTAGSGFGNSVTLSQSGGTLSSTLVYVRSSATAPSGNISGNVALTSTGAGNQAVAVKGVVSALPTVNPLGNQTVQNGAPTTAVSFTGPGNTYTWVNDTPGIGLAASSSGDIASFTAVNTGSSPVIATITVTPQSAQYAYVPNFGNSTISVVNTATNAVVSNITAQGSPFDCALSPDKSVAYITGIEANVSVVNTKTNAVLALVPLSGATGLAISPDGSRLYVSGQSSNTVSVINTTTYNVIANIAVGGIPIGVSISPDGSRLYVANSGANSVSVINTVTNSVIATVPVGSIPLYAAVSPDGSKIYVTNKASNNVSVISAPGNTVVATIPVGLMPYGVSTSPDGSHVYVINSDDSTVSVIDAATNAVIAVIQVGQSPYVASVSQDGNYLYVAGSVSNAISVINTATNTVIATIAGASASTNNNGSGSGCSGVPVKFTITVKPSPPSITASIASGTISACLGTASASPDIQQFTVSGSNLAGDITATAPIGFEVSLTSGSGFGSSVTISESSGVVNSTIVYVRSAASAATGKISGNVVLTSAGAVNQTVAVSGLVNTLPIVNGVPNQSVNNGAPTKTINFAGTGNTFTWVNDTPGIGLAASGTGDITSFTAVNTGSSPVIATITATPIAAGLAYIANSGSNTVSVINTFTNTVIATIPAGSNPYCVSVSPDGTRVYVTNSGSDNVTVINTATNTVVGTVPVGSMPNGITVSPDGSRFYVANLGSNSVSVINTATNALITTIPVQLLPFGVTVSPDGSRLYVTNSGSGSVSVINTATNLVIATITVGLNPLGELVSPDGSRLYVTNRTPGTISVISTATNAVISTIEVGVDPAGLSFSPDGSQLYVANQGTNYISIVSTATNTEVSTIKVGLNPNGVSVSADGSLLYVTNGGSNTVSAINTGTNSVIATINVDKSPVSIGNFITPGIGCGGLPTKFTITVNPSASPPIITAGPATGTISACEGSASVSPQIQQATVSGSNLAGDIIASVPTVFEISLSPNSGYGNSVTIKQSLGIVGNTILYVRSAASASAGIKSGFISLSSGGATSQTVAITETINALPTINQPANQTVTNGAQTTAVSFNGTGNTFTWTNDTPGIGLAASGTGDIGAFIAANTGSSPVTAKITVTPQSDGYAYITNGENIVSVINTSTNSSVANITVGSGPTGVAVNPVKNCVYVTNAADNTVSVISTTNNNITNTFSSRGVAPNDAFVSPDGSKLYVVNSRSGDVCVFNTSTFALIAKVPVATMLVGGCISPDGSAVYVTDGFSTITIINALTNAIVSAIPSAGSTPEGIAETSDGKLLYVANAFPGTVTVFNTATNAIVSVINVGQFPYNLAITPDDSRVYVLNNISVSVIDVKTQAVISTITLPGSGNPASFGIAVTPDGSEVYVNSSYLNKTSVINSATNTVVAAINVGVDPQSFGNFISKGTGCTGQPTQFTITVNPSNTAPTIIASPATGNISACAGTASFSPNIQQFTVSGSNLTGFITATAPPGFEVSLSAGSGYGGGVIITPTAGTVSNTLVYVRSAASAATGNIAGNVVLTSTGAASQDVAVKGTVNALPTVTAVSDQIVNNGAPTTAVNFTGSGTLFNWTNDTPGIGLPASGSGDIPSFTAVNSGSSAVTATITATPVSAGYAYIANEASGTVSVINTGTREVLSTIAVGSKPLGVSLSPDGSRAYVVNNNSNSVSVINTATNTVIATILVDLFPVGIVVSPDGSRVYVANESSNDISVINTATNTVVSTIPLGSSPYGIAVSPDGGMVYTTNYASNTVSVINTATNALVTNIPVGIFPIGVAVSPDGSRVYVTNQNSSTVSVIDAASNAVVSTIPVGTAPTGIAVSPDGSRVYVSNSNSDNVSVINTVSNAVIATITVGLLPYGISVSADGTLVYVANENAGTVSIINAVTNTLTANITVGSEPYSFGNFVTAGVSCSGAPVTFTITVKPTIVSAITAGTAAGFIAACEGTASASPQIQQFKVSGSGLTADIIATAPPGGGFEVSLTAGGGYGSNITLTETGGTVSTIVYVRSSASAAAGSISGNVVLTSTGVTSQNVAVKGIVNALAVINTVSNQTYTNGTVTSGVTFSGTANTINWVNDTPGIGLAASGTGNITPFTAVNTGSTQVIATITATPIPAGFAYIANFNANTVSVINTATSAVVATIPVGPGPIGVSVSQDGSRVYVANNKSNTVSVINTATNTVIATVTVGSTPSGISVSPDGSRVFVTNYVDNTVSVIDATTNVVISTIPVGATPFGISASPDGSRVYVANQGANNVSVINTATNAVIATIPVSNSPMDLTVSPDGSRVYVTNNQSSTVSVINTTSNIVVSNISVGSLPNGIAVSPDGSQVYVANNQSGTISVINTATNTVVSSIPVSSPVGLSVSADGSRLYTTGSTFSVINTATNTVITAVPAGGGSLSVGNFVVPSVGCPGPPATFTITVNPSAPPAPGITVSAATGSISACEGTASVSPDILQFTVSGNSLTDDIILAAPNNFEISLLPGSNYGSSLTLQQKAGTVNNTIIYVRSAASAPSPGVSGNVPLTSTGVQAKKVPVTATINALPTINPVSNQIFTNAIASAVISFTGTAGSYTWTNDTPGIGLAASGSGDIASFIPINNGNSPVIATIVVTPENNTGCTSPPVTFTITVDPTPAGVITAAGVLSPLTTVYGTASSSESFTVSGTNMRGGILVTPPPTGGFEVSADDVTYNSTLTIGAAGTIGAATVYIRLAATTHVGNTYMGNITLSSAGAADANESMPQSSVTPAKLVVIADDKSKFFGEANPVFTATYIGFVNNDGPAQLAVQPIITTTATTVSPVGQYPITATGASSPDYNITPVDGTLTINPVPQTVVIPNTFTPNGDGVNDTWNIKYIESFPKCTVEIFNRYGQNVYSSIGYGVAWDGTYKGAALPTGTYYYIINLKNSKNPLSGFVAIIR